MKPFQVILTCALLAVGLYAVALRRKILMLGNLAVAVTIIALFLVWWQEVATEIAGWLGIGRGVDLIFYCWVIISMVMILNLHLKIRIQAETVTELVRQLAIAQPLAGHDPNARQTGAGAQPVERAAAKHADRPNPDRR